MGQNISVDAEPVGLKDLLGLGLSSNPGEPSAAKLDFGSAAHHVKAWRFETRGNCFAEASVALCDRNGQFDCQLRRSSSYLILHVKGTQAASTTSSSELLDEFAARAGSTFTPRGLAAPCISRHEWGREPGQLRYAIFVWNGRGTEQLLRANVESKAYELDSHLRKGLDRQQGFVESLRKGVVLRGSQVSGMMSESGHQTFALPEASAGACRGRNVLLSSLMTPTPVRNGECKTWSRLSQAIMKGPLVKQGSSVEEKEPAPPYASSKVPPLKLGSPCPKASLPQGRPMIPKLALASLKEQGTAERSSPPPAITPSSGSSSTDSSEGMEIDDQIDSSSGRKRQRGGPDADVSPHRTPQTARVAPSPMGHAATAVAAAAAAAVMAPKTARGPLEFITPTHSTTLRGQSPFTEPANEATVPSTACAMPALNLGQLNGQKQKVVTHSDTPAMINLEDLNMTDEEMEASFDPDNEDNNYHLPDQVRRRLQLKHYRQICSEVLPGALYIASYQVASDEGALRKRNITHIVNCAADICDSCFPDKFQYLTYYLKDANGEEISLLFYRTLEWIHEAIARGGHVLVHCREGVSRSATFVIAYLMWRQNLSFEAAFDQIRQARPICNPNTGFTCQLLLLAKRLGTNGRAAPAPNMTSIFRVSPYHPKEPFLLLIPAVRQGQMPKFDPRFGWVVQAGSQVILWIGSKVPDPSATRVAVEEHLRRLAFFERCRCSLTVMDEGQESPLLWQVLGELGSAADQASLVCTNLQFDEDYDLLLHPR
eukprot:TRINITY_DN57302_c0_g1_i1.p1 TRINITY_DN57302_c0_g1~~TRINITY_DN57302_c0_g1_i1.p1  ORF type:complete len:770 (-),score=115.83 TRINITY_DN57302_c0_g1_i1:190-2499(-)